MAEVIGFAGLPEAVADRQHDAGHARRELQGAGEQRLAPGRHDMSLDQAGAWIGFHQRRQPHHGVAVQKAVGVEHDHEGVVGPARFDPLGDVAGLLAGVLGAPAVEQARFAGEPLAQFAVEPLFFRRDLGVGRVAQDEEVEGGGMAGGLQRALHDGEAARHFDGVFVVDGDQDRGAFAKRRDGAGDRRLSRQGHGMAPQDAQQEAEHAAPEGQRNPGEQQRKAGQEDRLQDLRPARRHDAPHQHEADGRRGEDKDQHEQPPPARASCEGIEPPAFRHGRKTPVQVSVRVWPRSCRTARRSTGFLPSGSKSMNSRHPRFQGRAST